MDHDPANDTATDTATVVRVGDGMNLDTRSRTATTRAGSVALTAVEYRLLRALAVGIGQVADRRSLARSAWPEGTRVARTALDAHVRRLRAKLASIGAPFRVETIHGLGFRMTALGV